VDVAVLRPREIRGSTSFPCRNPFAFYLRSFAAGLIYWTTLTRFKWILVAVHAFALP
jgi:hypothetical protein